MTTLTCGSLRPLDLFLLGRSAVFICLGIRLGFPLEDGHDWQKGIVSGFGPFDAQGDRNALL